MARITSISGETRRPLRDGWHCAISGPGAWLTPRDIPGETDFIPARVPGTAADALIKAGRWSWHDPVPLDERDVWYCCEFEASGSHRLVFDGLATIADIYLDGQQIASSRSMFVPLTRDVNLDGRHRLDVCFRSLGSHLENKAGRARWRPRMIQPPGLRNVRTTALGRMPGFAPPAPPVGPWRAVDLVPTAGLRVLRADVKSRVEGSTGILNVVITLAAASDGLATLACAGETTSLRESGARTYEGTLRIPDVALWWPHTHGPQNLHAVSAQIGSTMIGLGQTGFRTLEIDRGSDGHGFGLVVNGVPIFCRGAVWTAADPVTLDASRESLATLLQRARDAGMNMLRVSGAMSYESDVFFALCDELGILVWHDFMFANFDYPIGDPAFRELVEAEARCFLDRAQTSPALAVLCGGSEVYQQAAMLGIAESRWRSRLFDEILPTLTREIRPDCAYVENSPSGGALPFHSDAGVAHYYGVGAYRRPLEDARRAEVRFASECLGFANVPDAARVLRDFGSDPVADPLWNARIPRDWGADQEFEQVRDHYVAALYGVDVPTLRTSDAQTYLNLGRAAVAEAMEATFAEWRRPGSPTRGGLVWFYKDLWPSSGWGVLDWTGEPKSAWYALKRAFRPVQLLLCDEGVNGLRVHLINETAEPVDAVVTLECFKDATTRIMQAERVVRLAPRSTQTIADVDFWGAFFDTPYAYHFGPPSHDVTVARLTKTTGATLAEAFHFPLGRSALKTPGALDATVERDEQGWVLRLRASSFVQSVRIEDAALAPDDDWFHLAPGRDAIVRLTGKASASAEPCGVVTPLFGAPIAYGQAK